VIGWAWRLRIGTKLTGYTVVPDDTYAGMWRWQGPDGKLSDRVNLSRAKDAAMARAHKGGTEVFHWDNRQTPPLAVSMRYFGPPGDAPTLR